MQLSREELEGDNMQVGDLVQENSNNPLGRICGDVGYTLGIIIDVEDGVATVSWFWHQIFGAHESYCVRQELTFFNKNT